MKKMIKLYETVKLKRKMWEDIADGLIVMIVHRARRLNKNYKDEKFSALSEQYKKYKKRGMRTFTTKDWSDGPRSYLGKRKKGTRLIGTGSESISSKSGKANMTLTGKTLDNLAVRKSTSSYAIIGWIGPAAERVRQLFKTKNYQIVGLKGSEVLAKKEEIFIRKEIAKAIDGNIKKYNKQTIIINLGK